MQSERRISDLLTSLAAQEGETLTVRDILDHFGERALGAMMVVFSAPLVLPMPPGVSAVLGLPLVIFTAQLTVGGDRPWLPKMLSARVIRRRDLSAVVVRVLPLVGRIERLLHQRQTWLLNRVTRRLVGLVAFLLAIVVFLPIPFGNMFPSMAIAVLGLGLVERDGLAVLAGSMVAVASLLFLAIISHALWAAILTFFRVLAAPFLG